MADRLLTQSDLNRTTTPVRIGDYHGDAGYENGIFQTLSQCKGNLRRPPCGRVPSTRPHSGQPQSGTCARRTGRSGEREVDARTGASRAVARCVDESPVNSLARPIRTHWSE